VKVDSKKIPLYSIHTNPSNSNEFAVSGREPIARVYDKRKANQVVKTYCPHHLLDVSGFKANITCLVYNYDGSELLCSYNDEDIYLFDTSHSQGADYIKRYKGHRNNATVKGVNFYGDRSEYVVSGSDCGNIFFWERESQQILHYVEGDKGGVVNVIEPHPNLPVLATSGLDSEVKIWTPRGLPSHHQQQRISDSKLKQLMLSNLRERIQDRQDRESMPDTFQSHLLWFLMRTLRNRQRSSQDNDSDDSSDSNDSDGLSSDSSHSSIDEEELVNPIRCPQS